MATALGATAVNREETDAVATIREATGGVGVDVALEVRY